MAKMCKKKNVELKNQTGLIVAPPKRMQIIIFELGAKSSLQLII